MNFKPFIRRAVIFIAAAIMVFGSCLSVNAMHDPDFTQSSTTWDLGTGVTCYIKGGTLYFEGNGVIPDYTNDTISKRPYHTSIIGSVVVGKGVTDIGSRAFAEFPYLKYINVHSTTFIKDSSAFHKIDSAPMLRLMGKEVATRMMGDNVPYTSLDSWVRIAQTGAYNIEYVVDDWEVKRKFRSTSYPDVLNVQCAFTENIAAADHLAEHDKPFLREYASPLRFAPGSVVPTLSVTSKIAIPGDEYMRTVGLYLQNVIPGYKYGVSLQNCVSLGDKYYHSFPDVKKYVLNIPAEAKGPGRTYKIIIAWDGGTAVLDDLDSSSDTITFATDQGSFTYSVVYAEPGVAATSGPVIDAAAAQQMAALAAQAQEAAKIAAAKNAQTQAAYSQAQAVVAAAQQAAAKAQTALTQNPTAVQNAVKKAVSSGVAKKITR